MGNGNKTFNWNLVGNNHIKEYLEKSILKDSVSGAYIFNGPDNLGKTTLAVNFAKVLLCESKRTGNKPLPCNECPACRLIGKEKKQNASSVELFQNDIEYNPSAHGDLHLIKREKDKKNISIAQIRELIKSLGMSSFLNSYKIGIIKHADSMNDEAANALLKTLEEPKAKVVIILITSNLDKLPSTIFSRCQVLNFREVRSDVLYDYLVEERKIDRVKAKNLSRQSLGRPALAKKFVEDGDFFDTYNKRVDAFVEVFSGDVNRRFTAIETIMGKDAKGQESARKAERILDIWLGLARDLLLNNYGHKDLVQHQSRHEQLESIGKNFDTGKLLDINRVMARAKDHIRSNVNPKLALEYVALHI